MTKINFIARSSPLSPVYFNLFNFINSIIRVVRIVSGLKDRFPGNLVVAVFWQSSPCCNAARSANQLCRNGNHIFCPAASTVSAAILFKIDVYYMVALNIFKLLQSRCNQRCIQGLAVYHNT